MEHLILFINNPNPSKNLMEVEKIPEKEPRNVTISTISNGGSSGWWARNFFSSPTLFISSFPISLSAQPTFHLTYCGSYGVWKNLTCFGPELFILGTKKILIVISPRFRRSSTTYQKFFFGKLPTPHHDLRVPSSNGKKCSPRLPLQHIKSFYFHYISIFFCHHTPHIMYTHTHSYCMLVYGLLGQLQRLIAPKPIGYPYYLKILKIFK